MNTKMIIMRPGEPSEEREVDLAPQPTLRELDAVLRPQLDGGDLEHVLVYAADVPFLGKRGYRDMFVDEVGHRKNLPRNEAATELYCRNVRLHEPEKLDDPDYFIVGPAVFFPDRRIWF
jgi:hypothetical protein